MARERMSIDISSVISVLLVIEELHDIFDSWRMDFQQSHGALFSLLIN
jgi:hypothetical protein